MADENKKTWIKQGNVDATFPKNIELDLTVSDIKELSSDSLDALIMNGIKGLIIDLDETLRFNKEDITKVNGIKRK